LKILILADGNNEIGMGHVYRELNLAKYLVKKKHKILFLTNQVISKKMISKKYDCIFSKNLQFKNTQNILKKFIPDLIILDKLNESKANIVLLSKLNPKIVGIDYIGKNKKFIPYGINYLYQKNGIKTNYSNFKFSILNQFFLKAKRIKIQKEVKTIIILQGGADTYCFTPKIIDSLNNIQEKYKIIVVIGPAFRCWKDLENSIDTSKNTVIVKHNVKNMVTLLKKADLAITAAGNTLLELANLGIPSLVICAERFENETAHHMETLGFGKNLGFGGDLSIEKITLEIRKIIQNYKFRKKMNLLGPRIIDGNGIKRVEKIFLKIVKNTCNNL